MLVYQKEPWAKVAKRRRQTMPNFLNQLDSAAKQEHSTQQLEDSQQTQFVHTSCTCIQKSLPKTNRLCNICYQYSTLNILVPYVSALPTSECHPSSGRQPVTQFVRSRPTTFSRTAEKLNCTVFQPADTFSGMPGMQVWLNTSAGFY